MIGRIALVRYFVGRPTKPRRWNTHSLIPSGDPIAQTLVLGRAASQSTWSGCCQQRRAFSCRSIHGPRFYKRRPIQLPYRRPRNYRKKWMEMKPQRRGICERVFVKAPRKPGSGLRRVCYVRLLNGRLVLAFIPGEGHNLSVHSAVLVQGGHVRDIPGCNMKCIRGKLDLLPVKGRQSARSKYGVKLSSEMRERKLRIRYQQKYVSSEKDRVTFNRLKYATWRNVDGSLQLNQLGKFDPVPEHKGFNYKWKFIQWKIANTK